jgi:uncharacterized protein (DUF488 family)
MPGTPDPKPVFTIGHSTRSIEEFVGLLQTHGIEQVADIRTIPKSRRVPHFNGDALERALADAGIGYVHLKELGGLRHPRKESPNTGWRNESFRGYADYMQTPAFAAALVRLVEISRARTTAIMCAEAVPWRCHRSLVADALTVGMKLPVLHIMSATQAARHIPTNFLRIVNGAITYPPEDAQEQLELDLGEAGSPAD